MNGSFGEFIKEKRLAAKCSLRQFAKKVGMQASNYCNVENGALPPPSDKLDDIASALGITKRSMEYNQFHDLAAKARNEVPADIARMVKESALIPALLRTVEGEKVSEKQIRGIIEDLKSGRSKKRT